jgi:hypothetical protein
MSEPIFDIEQLEEIKDQETADLIAKLLLYAQSLEEQVVELRKEVNRLTPRGEPTPYEDLHSDIYENFDDHPVYVRHRDTIELFFTY